LRFPCQGSLIDAAVLDNINEILLTATVALGAAAIALRLLLRVSRVEWIARFFKAVLGYVDVGLSALVIALLIRTFVVEPFKIPSSSMENTLLIGDHLFVNRFIYGLRVPFVKSRPLALRKPRRGDIVVFVPPHQRGKDFIKRVIGTPGDTVEIRERRVYINGRPIDESYVVHKEVGSARNFYIPRDNMPKISVPPGSYFLLGDNRDRSEDSRYWGFVPLVDIKGKAMIIYFSWNPEPKISSFALIRKIRWKRLGARIS
jgi:signal peptidase I